MKKILIVLILSPLIGVSQTYRNYVERFEDSYDGQGYSYSANVGHATSTHESGFLQFYLDMFNATKDRKYLDKFIIHAKRVQERRDDNLYAIPFSEVEGFPYQFSSSFTVTDLFDDITYFLPTSKGWSVVEFQNTYNTQRVLHSGGITFPMAEFIYFLSTDPDFMLHANDLAPDEARGTYLGGNNIQTYTDFANWLRVRVNETLQWHECNWSCWDARYHHDCGGGRTDCQTGQNNCTGDECRNNTDPEVINMQCAIGSALAMMYLVESEQTGNPTYAAMYLNHISNIGIWLHSNVLQTFTNDPNAYTWTHDYSGLCGDDIGIEDMGHAAITMRFADICYQYNIISDHTFQPIFTLTDMTRFANTFANHMYRAPLDFAQNTFGTDQNICNPPTNYDPLAGYIFLSKYNPYIYQAISDYFFDLQIGNTEVIDAFANLALYEHLFNPLAVLRSSYPNINFFVHSVASTASGDFDGNGDVEFASAYSAGTSTFIQVNEFSTSNIIAPQNTNVLTINDLVSSITAGEFDPTHPGDELAVCVPSLQKIFIYSISASSYSIVSTINASAISISTGDFNNDGEDDIVGCDNGTIHIFQNTGSGLVLISSTVTAQANSVTAGDFDINHPGDEIVTIGTIGGELNMYSLLGTVITNMYNYPMQGGLNFPGIASGDFDGDIVDEIIAYCSTDGAYKIYKLKNGQITHDVNDEEYFPTNQLNGVMCSARFQSDLTKDALITQRSFDGQIAIFDMEGLCPGLNLSNQTIDMNTSTNNIYHPNSDNNFNLDYHVSNTLIAGNNFNIDAPSMVTFTAGNEVILLPGFIANAGCDFVAYIDPGIACNNPSFRLGNAAPEIASSSPVENMEREEKGSCSLIVSPNPSSQKFTYEIKGIGAFERTYHVKIIDVFGNVVFQENTKYPTGEIDISEYSVGIYLLHISSDEGMVWDERVMVSH